MSANPMNGMNILFPNLAQTQQQIEMERQLGSQFMGQGMQTPQMQSIGGVAIRQSPIEGLARMLQTWGGAAMAQDAMQKQSGLNQQYAQYLRGQFGMGDSAPAQDPGIAQQQSDADSNPAYAASLQALSERGAAPGPTKQSSALAQALMAQQPAAAGAGVQQQPAPAAPSSGQGMNMTIPGMSPQQAMGMYLMNPDKYSEAMLSQYKAPDIVTKMRAAGIDPSSQIGRQLLQGNIAKDNYIAPVEGRPGGWTIYPDGRRVWNPSVPTGGMPTYDQGGNFNGVAPLPGAAGVAQGQSQAEAAGKAAVKPMTAYDANGQPVFTNELAAAQGGGQPGAGGRFGGYQVPGQPSGQLRPAPVAGTNEGRAAIAQANAKKFNDLTAGAADSPTRINVLDNIIQLSQDGVNTGPGAAWQNKILGYAANSPILGSLVAGKQNSVAQFQEMQKFLAQNGLRQWQAAGGTGTDAQLNAAMHANPNDSHFPQALQALAKWNKAGELALQAKANAANAYMQQNGNDATQYNQFDNLWRQNFDPRIAQMQLMNPQELQQFTSKLAPSDRSGLLKKYQFVKQQGWM